ncbi:hypothetical protein [Microbacterium sp. NPDC086615]|uniref:hypothetical protein n=1 Tax=Microbacterium sp. NPDC086615 TaxID=3154865 RepID=UPI003418306D
MKALDDKIEANRADALRISSSGRARIKAVQEDPRLTDLAKREQAAHITDEVRPQLADLAAREQQMVNDHVRFLQRQIYGTAGTSPEAVITFRDAQERADKIEEQRPALTAMQRALVNKDDGMARALLGRAFDQGWAEVVAAYSAENPALETYITDLRDLLNFKNNLGAQLTGSWNYQFGGGVVL